MANEPQKPEFPSGHSFDLYLRRLRWALSALPETDRDEIVAETLSLLLDSLGGNATYEEAAKRLGEPEDYARGFLDSFEISATLGSGSPWRMLLLTPRLAGRNFFAFLSVAGLFTLYSVAISLIGIALLKPIFPEHVGLWVHPGGETIVAGYLSSPPVGTEEYLGLWIIPVSLMIGLGLFRLSSSLSRRFLASWRGRR